MPISWQRRISSSVSGFKRACISPPTHFKAAAANTPSGAPPVPTTMCTPEPSIQHSIAGLTSPSEMSIIRAPTSRASFIKP